MASLFALALAVIFSWYNYRVRSILTLEIAASKNAVEELEKRAGAPAAEGSGLSKKDIDFINTTLARRAFSWTSLLTDLEASLPGNVYLSRITPDFAKGAVNVTGVAGTLKDALDMVDMMGSSGRFKRVFMLKHSEEGKKGGSGGAVVFSLSAGYEGGTP